VTMILPTTSLTCAISVEIQFGVNGKLW